MRLQHSVYLVIPALLVLACDDDSSKSSYQRPLDCEGTPDEPAPPEPMSAALQQAAGCDDVVASIRTLTLQQMNKTLDRNLQQALALRCADCIATPSYGGGGFGCGAAMSEASGVGSMADGGVANSQPDAGDSASEWSTTNLQEAEVDEPDFMKNDGAFIYIVANGKFRIVDAWPPEQAHTLAAVPIDGNPTGLFVFGDRAVVYSNLGWGGTPPCTYGYFCQFEGSPGPWLISVFDITDRAAPQLVRKLTVDGALLSSRRVGTIVHSVMLFGDQAQQQYLPYWEEWPQDVPYSAPYCNDGPPALSADDIRQKFAALRERNRIAIEGFQGPFTPPSVVDERLNGAVWERNEQVLASCGGFYVSAAGQGARLLSLLSFDLLASAPLGTTTVVGNAGAVYATTDALYVAQSSFDIEDWYYYQWGYGAFPETTAIHKFRLTDNSVVTTYVGSGQVDGHVLSQFSLDEYNGLLRVATSVGWVPDPNAHSVVTVLAEDSGALSAIGKLDGIAPGEDIRSVLFDGNVVYLVTFKKTDPLFIVDLSNPRAPTVKSELKVPGFSTYMQMMDADHVLTIGFDAQDMGDFAWFQGIQLQIFNVTDPYHPQLVHKELIGTRGTNSEAATNHLAFNYFAPKEALALPMVICEGSSGGSDYGDRLTFDGLLVYHVTVADGFTKLGGLPHSDPATADPYACYTWWSDPNSGVKRSIFMDDYVWAVAMDNIRVAAMTDVSTPLATVDLRY